MQTPSAKPIYGIGIDTGGTFTDAVLVDLRSHAVLGIGKRPTIHHNLGQGIVDVLNDILSAKNAGCIKTIAFSTTLATNAIAEGRGAKVGLMVIGPVKPFDAPVVCVRYLDGGHDHLGREVKPLSIERIVDAVADMKGHVDAYAIAAAMSMENPTHEQVAAKAVELADPKPVFCSHTISSRAGIRERAATAVLHARLMPVIEGFVTHIKQLADDRCLTTDMRMIHGDTTATALPQAIRRAAGTVASGPAASAYFGAKSAAAQMALVVDVGGTTTDITLVENGKPVLSGDGSLIDQWQTHIDAVDMHTLGIGGDSLVCVDHAGEITVGPRRVQPLAMAGAIPNPASWIGAKNRSRWIIRPDCHRGQDATPDPILAYLRRQGGTTPAGLMAHFGMSDFGLDRRLEDLAFRCQVAEVGFTPTDALHVLDKLHIGDKQASISGARILASLRSQPVEAFCRRIVGLAQQKITDAIIGYAFRKQTGRAMDHLFAADQEASLLSLAFKLNVPIVGIGAAARQFLPEVAQRLHTRLILPPHFEVGNAVGAIMIANEEQR